MFESDRNVSDLHFLPHQGGRGDYSQVIKGEQGILGFPGNRVGDFNQTALC